MGILVMPWTRFILEYCTFMPFCQGEGRGYSAVEYQSLLIKLSAEIPTIGFLLDKLMELRNTSTGNTGYQS